MILVALLFIAIGVADIIRERFRRPVGPVLGIIAGTIAAVLAGWGLGIAPLWVAAVVGVMIAWVAITALPSSGQSGYLKLALLGAAIGAAWAFTPVTPDAASPVADWYDALPYGFTESTDVSTFALGIGGVLLLAETANIVVRLVLAAAPRGPVPPSANAAPSRRTWFSRSGRTAVSPSPRVEPPLKGGRIIGPFERVFLLALVLAGQFTALAAVVAAKGIIRFPEIAKDEAGSKAEYFLVGSFASWAVVLLVAVLISTA